MKNILYTIPILFMMLSCSEKEGITKETQALKESLSAIHTKGVMFGHQDDPVYGIRWEFEDGRSDVKSVCGDYPAVMSFDVGHIELGNAVNLDAVPFDLMRKEIIDQYNRGGMTTISWHPDNPITGKDSWDNSNNTVVRSILEGGEKHELFLTWLDRLADFFNSVETEDGVKVPILFRPWHEHTGSWFWWGKDLCTIEEYKALWKLTYDHLNNRGVNNLLYAYSPGAGYNTEEEYLQRYPNGDIIDLLGFDIYVFDENEYDEQSDSSFEILTSIGMKLNKPIALTETGYETIPDEDWWTTVLLAKMVKYPVTYVVIWRNAREKENHYYAPYPGHPSAADFVKFYDSPKTLFAKDIEKIGLY